MQNLPFLEKLATVMYRKNLALKEPLAECTSAEETIAFMLSIEREELLGSLIDLYKSKEITLENIAQYFKISNEQFLEAVAKKLKFDVIDLDKVRIDYRLCEKLKFAELEQLGVLPYEEDEISVYIAFKDPFDLEALDAAQEMFSRKLMRGHVAPPHQIDRYLAKVQLRESIKGIILEIRKDLSADPAASTNTDSSGVLKLIEVILRTSIVARASDIHIEPTETNCVVRGRIDGMLSELFMFDKDIYGPLISRLKLLSNMDIAEKRRPQDGRFSATVLENEYDFRISTLPIINGESIVLRILDKSKVLIELKSLGMHPVNFERLQAAMHAPYGIILVTGPTGSGKTTTLYAALNDMKDVTTKIITVEDPVEYQLEMIQQVHVNERAGMTFAAALRSILRQDPDIIMIGEIRDKETLTIAIQAALTGHLVFSTLHTNDAVSAVTRIADMGIEGYMISGALAAIEAQRLVRRLCPECKQKTTLPDDLLARIEKYLPEVPDYQFYKATGCAKCGQTGYAGREMISEILPVSEYLASRIAANAPKDELRKIAYDEGFVDMFHDGVVRAARGSTTMEEVLRVAKD